MHYVIRVQPGFCHWQTLLPPFLGEKAKAVESQALEGKCVWNSFRKVVTSTEAKRFLQRRLTSFVCCCRVEPRIGGETDEAPPHFGLPGPERLLRGSAPCWESDRGPRGILEPSTVICPKQWLKYFLNEEKQINKMPPPKQQQKDLPRTQKSWISEGALMTILIKYTGAVSQESKDTSEGSPQGKQ